jgi:hypothetical protein
MHKNINSIFSYLYDIPSFNLKWLLSWRWLAKGKVLPNYVTVVELYFYAVGGIYNVFAWEIYVW